MRQDVCACTLDKANALKTKTMRIERRARERRNPEEDE
jgi:hypothetical protein